MANVGAYPIDPATEVGWLRTAILDEDGTPHVPPDGKADYQYVSDAALRTVIDLYPDDRLSQKAAALDSIGNRLVQEAQLIQVDDIKIDTRQRGEYFLKLAEAAWGVANAGPGGAGAFFGIVPTNTGGNACDRRPEGTPYLI